MTKTKKTNQDDVLNLRIPTGLKSILQTMANNNNRKLGDFVRLELMKLTNYVSKKK